MSKLESYISEAIDNIETLQRSNEQLVKVSALVSKKSSTSGLTADDKEEIYDLLNRKEDPEDTDDVN